MNCKQIFFFLFQMDPSLIHPYTFLLVDLFIYKLIVMIYDPVTSNYVTIISKLAICNY